MARVMHGIRVWLWLALAGASVDCSRSTQAAPAHSPKERERGSGPGVTSPSAQRDCATLIDTINEVVVEIERVSARRGAREGEHKRDVAELSALYAKLDRRVTSLKLEARELRDFGSEYRELIRKVQKSLTELQRALDRDDFASVEKAQSDFVHVIELENDLVERINAFCETKEQTA